jgi:hypothetical protein
VPFASIASAHPPAARGRARTTGSVVAVASKSPVPRTSSSGRASPSAIRDAPHARQLEAAEPDRVRRPAACPLGHEQLLHEPPAGRAVFDLFADEAPRRRRPSLRSGQPRRGGASCGVVSRASARPAPLPGRAGRGESSRVRAPRTDVAGLTGSRSRRLDRRPDRDPGRPCSRRRAVKTSVVTTSKRRWVQVAARAGPPQEDPIGLWARRGDRDRKRGSTMRVTAARRVRPGSDSPPAPGCTRGRTSRRPDVGRRARAGRWVAKSSAVTSARDAGGSGVICRSAPSRTVSSRRPTTPQGAQGVGDGDCRAGEGGGAGDRAGGPGLPAARP